MKKFTFDITKEKSPHILSAVIGADSFFYGLYDRNFTLYKCDYFEQFSFSLAEYESLANELSAFQDVKQVISFSTKPYLHVPLGEGNITKFYPSFDDKQVNIEKLTAQEISVLFGLKEKHVSFVKEVFNAPSVHHISTVFHNEIFPSSKDQVVGYFEDERLHLLVSDMDKLKYYNQFECRDKTDHLYFIAMVYNLLGYDMNEVPLAICGRIEQSSELHDLLYGYVRNIKFLNSRHQKIADLRLRKSAHLYHDLYSTAICG